MALHAPTDHLDMAFQITRHQRPLLPSDAEWLQPNIVRLEMETRRLDQQITALSIVLSHLCASRDAVDRSLQAHKAVFAPILRLPRDILLQIFTFCVPDPDGDSCLDARGPRWNISKVCGLWREVIMSSPMIWSNIIVRQAEVTDATIHLVREHLRLSGSTPLIVGIDCPSLETPTTPYLGLLELIASHCWRWKLLEIRGDEQYVLGLFKDMETSDMVPLLEEIYVYTRGVHTDWTTQMFVNAPVLRRVDIPRYSLEALNMPTRLTHYSGAVSTANDIRFMNLCTSLKEWHLHTSRVTPEFETEALVSLHNDNITHLRVDYPKFLDSLTLPRLESLLIHTPDSDVTIDAATAIDSLVRFLERSECKLKTLIAVEPSIYQATRFVSDVLPRQPSIKTLEINVDRTILSWLTRTPIFPGLLPQLQSLTVATPENVFEDPWDAGLAEMLHSRRKEDLAAEWKCVELEEFRLDTTDEAVMAGMRVKLGDLEESGLQILDAYDYTWRFWEGPGWFDE